VVEVDSETQWWPSQSRKESILNYLLIDIQNGEAKWGGGTKKGDKEWINKITSLLEEGKTETVGKVNIEMKTMAACLEWLTWLGRKDKQTAECLKKLWILKSEKYRSAKNRIFEQILWYNGKIDWVEGV